MIVTVLRILFWIALGYSVGYGLLWLSIRIYVTWYMANGGL
jgi:hypothetical protein